MSFFKKAWEDQLISDLKQNLQNQKVNNDIDNYHRQTIAMKYLLSAANLLDDAGLLSQAERITQIIAKFAWEVPHETSPTLDQMVHNLEENGTVFPTKDYQGAKDSFKISLAPNETVEIEEEKEESSKQENIEI